jgi:excisionase family DNA binding protein
MTATQPESVLLTLEQAAERLCTSVRFLRRLRAERRLPFVKLGKHLRVDSRDLEAFVASCREEIPARRR